jgi:single-strand DNA-binding protein|uniref:Single-stranded DNA-binding protein n=1 Tax=Siphoviridae sp. ctS1E53 TaxID=2826340 RepID=A0A8S5ME77_9CAUD|nr:MAG TPA: Single strand binding protein [Siphoviridae sp. ctS1E53]
MNKLTIIGNLTRDPETRVTQSGSSVCSFTVAVNRRGQDDKTDFFRVSAWNKTGETCQKYLAKGRKVAVTGPVSVSTYTGQDGKAYANLEVMAQDVEFLTPKGEQAAPAPAAPANNGYQEVTDDDLPF